MSTACIAYETWKFIIIGDVGISTGRLTGVIACAILVFLMAAFCLALEGIQMRSNFSAYIKNWINYLEIVLYLSSVIFVHGSFILTVSVLQLGSGNLVWWQCFWDGLI